MKKVGILVGVACFALFACTKNELSKSSLTALDASKKASPEAVLSELSVNNNGIIKGPIPNDELMEIMGQTPIDIPVNNTVKFKASDPEFHYEAIHWDVVNNPTLYPGDKIERNLKVNVATESAGKNYVMISGHKYELLQFHFHYSSEHAFMGKKSAMEVHLVHKDPVDGDYAVLGALIKIDEANEFLGEIFEAAPSAEAAEGTHIDDFDPSHLLPDNANIYYTYSGSLTTPGGGLSTPPYLEGLTWIVFKGQKTISQEQFDLYKEIFEEPNSREIQPIGNRVVYEHVGSR